MSAPDPHYSDRGWQPADPPTPFFARHADALYQAVDDAIRARRVDARSPIGDAALDYRDERDRMARRAQEGPVAPSATYEALLARSRELAETITAVRALADGWPIIDVEDALARACADPQLAAQRGRVFACLADLGVRPTDA